MSAAAKKPCVLNEAMKAQAKRTDTLSQRRGHETRLAFSTSEIADLVDDLARNAEAVCRHYLSNGRRQGGYWCVGDLGNTPGRSLFVRLRASGKGATGKWTDAQSGEHGDLLDIIRETRGLRSFPEVVAEARRFLGLPDDAMQRRGAQLAATRPTAALSIGHELSSAMPEAFATAAAARRLWAASRPIEGTLAETYLRRRGIAELADTAALRFLPRCFYRLGEGDPQHAPPDDTSDQPDWQESLNGAEVGVSLACPPHCFLPALIAAVTDNAGAITGVQRTYLDTEALASGAPLGDRLGKATVLSSRRALGDLLGNGVRFGSTSDIAHCGGVLVAGEGVETLLSLRMVLPALPMVAALSAGHLGAFLLPPDLRRLYVAEDADAAGRATTARLLARAEAAGIEAIVLRPRTDDFNGDLRRFGIEALAAHLRPQLAAEDVARFLRLADHWLLS
ncbi:MAG: DUF7146 domain-containing protein [Beijerinckiaceae bacterium]